MFEVALTGSVWAPADGVPAVEQLLTEPVPTYNFNHTFWDCAVSLDRLREICEEQGWKTFFLDGEIKYQAVWVENHTYLELCPQEYIGLYEKLYGSAGRATMRDYLARRFGSKTTESTA
jgi:hypothetical protein